MYGVWCRAVCVNPVLVAAAVPPRPGQVAVSIELFRDVININLVGTFSVPDQAAELMAATNPAPMQRGDHQHLCGGL
jgi:NAD(P)-dependent dehydrogenase (short-subunit alcohol dehydrogenase family)